MPIHNSSAVTLAAAGGALLVGLAGCGDVRPTERDPATATRDGAWVNMTGDGGRVIVGPGEVVVESADGNRVVVGSPPVSDPPTANPRVPNPPVPPGPPAVLGEVIDDAAFIGDGAAAEYPDASTGDAVSSGVPEWATNPPAGRTVVVGPFETDPERAKRSARPVAAEALAELAGVPAWVVHSEDAVRRLTRLSAVEPVTRTTGEHTFTVYRARLLLDVETRGIERLDRAHRRYLSDERAGVAAGAFGALAGLFGAVWGVGRRKLKRA